jgi:hypothetical protein
VPQAKQIDVKSFDVAFTCHHQTPGPLTTTRVLTTRRLDPGCFNRSGRTGSASPITARLIASVLCADHAPQSESQLLDIKTKVKQITRRLNRNSATEASIEADSFNIQ